MNKKNRKVIVTLGILCLLLVAASCWYSISYNQSRLVVPMDFSTYVFQIKDLPMICSLFTVCAYGVYLLFQLIKTIMLNRKNQNNTQHQITRRINPQLGFLGFLGFTGFGGFWTYSINKTISPFAFFLFFGFFGFFYEGKMSNTFMDERYKENAKRAQLASFKIGYMIIFLLLILLGQGAFMGNLEYTLLIFVIGISLSLALVLFLSEYLLYRYDASEMSEEEE